MAQVHAINQSPDAPSQFLGSVPGEGTEGMAQVRTQPRHVNAVQPSCLARRQGKHVKIQPGRHRMRLEIRGRKAARDDGLQPLHRCVRRVKPFHNILAVFPQDMAHRGQQDLILAAEIMMRQPAGHARTPGNLRHGHVK